MRKLIYAILSLVSLLSLSMTQETNAQSLRLDVRNQQYNGDTLFFDIYLSRNGGSADYYLGDADFILNYNNANFSSPTIGIVSASSSLKNHSGGAVSYNSAMATELGTANPNTNKIMISVLQPSFANQTAFETNIARIDTDTLTHRLGTFWIKGLQNATQSPNLTWVTAGSGIRTSAYTLNTTQPWKSTRITSLTTNNPTVGTEPTTQVTSMSVTTKTDTSISLSWTRGNGNQVIVLAKQGSAVGSDLPTDGILYDADSFGVGSQLGSTGVYVIYRGTATSTTVLNLDPETHYYFAAVEVSGLYGYSENYRAASPATANDTTKAGEPGTSATNLQITAFTTSTLDLSWTSGSGSNRIVVAKSGSAVSVDPSDAFAYTSTGDFTTGQDLGSGNIVVYDGNGSTASVSGLTANTEYHFAVYEYNGSNGARNYKIDTPAVNDRFTLQTEPTTASTAGSFINVAPTSMTFHFTPGNGANRIILIHSAAAVDADPVDGTAYTANAAYSSGDQIGTGNYVVYTGSDSIVNVTGLTANTTYYYEVFEVNGSGESNNYLTSSTLTKFKTTTEAEPATSATALTVDAWSTTTLDLSWTNGDGANRIVVARATSAVDFVPVDTNAYTANASFSSGTALGGSNDNYVVYNGSGSSVQVTNLTPNTEYHFAVYEYNGSNGAQNYKIDTPAIADRFTLQTEPTTASTAGSFINVAPTSMTFHFTPGNGANRIILIHSAAAVNADPVDGTAYTANAAYSSGDQIGTGNYVVYNGSDSIVNVTGLTANTTYYYEVFEVNGSGESNNYLTSSTLTKFKTTTEAEPATSATALTVDAWSTTTLDLSWTNGDGANRIVVARATSAVDFAPVDTNAYTANASFSSGTALGGSNDNYVVYNGSGTSVQVTNLTPNTEYHFAVYEYNGSNGAQNYKIDTPAIVDRYTLQTEPTTASTNAGFTSITTTGMTFHFDEGDGANRIILIHEGAAVDADPADGLAYTANTTYASGQQIGTGNYVVYIGSDTFVSISGLTANTTYHYEVFEVNGSGESNNYLTSSSLVADEITLQSAPTIAASDLLITNVTTSTMELDWTNGNGANRIVVARAVSAVSATPVNGTDYTENGSFGSGNAISAGQFVVYDGSGSSVTVSGLGQDTVYSFAVYEYNGTAGSQNYLTTTPATADSNTAIQLNITVLLEGPFNGTTMDTVLNEIDSIPLTQPYNTAPWNYGGSEDIAAVPYDVVDWVYVQVRKSSSAATALAGTIVAEQAGFLMANGLIMDSTGTTEMILHPSQAGYGELYVVIYHRNHIGVMSATTMSYDSDSSGFVFDFTTGAGQAYGSAALVLSGSRYVMYAGNADPSGTAINSDDRDAAWDARNAYGYRQEDVNMDGNVTSGDRSAVHNNTGQDEQIP